MRYRAKVDWRIGLALAVAMAMPAINALVARRVWMLAPPVVIAAIVLAFCWPQWYETRTDVLVIRAGLTTQRIPYGQITLAQPSSSRRSSVAMSLDRVEIRHGSRSSLIAPVEREAFLQDVTSRLTAARQSRDCGVRPAR